MNWIVYKNSGTKAVHALRLYSAVPRQIADAEECNFKDSMEKKRRPLWLNLFFNQQTNLQFALYHSNKQISSYVRV